MGIIKTCVHENLEKHKVNITYIKTNENIMSMYIYHTFINYYKF